MFVFSISETHTIHTLSIQYSVLYTPCTAQYTKLQYTKLPVPCVLHTLTSTVSLYAVYSAMCYPDFILLAAPAVSLLRTYCPLPQSYPSLEEIGTNPLIASFTIDLKIVIICSDKYRLVGISVKNVYTCIAAHL